ncbi:benzyl alcohol O-benzoyltransferase-like [Ananas comosus]|uniref:Benzyl alcohol O-benzoyltransferase-like n=1 Tax=Ananas comosus TaxID=4615 RepID=A0A6P5EE04_ANACO|nr:benzyl alcohol O-benzoyltransferase-like [Ananas comosus]
MTRVRRFLSAVAVCVSCSLVACLEKSATAVISAGFRQSKMINALFPFTASAQCSLTYNARRSEAVLVAPEKPTPYELKPLSDIDDQCGLRFYRSGILFFRNNPAQSGRDPAAVIKQSLAEALVYYYPLAGRLRAGPDDKLIVECTGEGAVFVEAEADVRLEDFDGELSPPIPCNDQLLCEPESTSSDVIGRPLVYIQVTRLVCGGFILGIQLCHCMADAVGLMQFVMAMFEMAAGAAEPTIPPVWAREMLNARSPPCVTHPHPEYEEVPDPTKDRISPADVLAHRPFFFGEKEMSALHRQAPAYLRGTCSRFDMIAAYVWRCRTIALGYDPEDEVRVQFVVNARGKRNNAQGRSPVLPHGFYGNAFVFTVASSTAGELCRKPFSYALELVAAAKARSAADDHLQSVADLMVLKGRPRFATARTYLVSDLTKMGLDELDFGWGTVVYAGPATAMLATFHLPARSAEGERGILVPVRLPEFAIERFVAEMERGILMMEGESHGYGGRQYATVGSTCMAMSKM